MGKNFIEKYLKMPKPAKAAFWFVVCSFLQKSIFLITAPIFTRFLTLEEYGQYVLYNSWLGIISILITFKLSEAVFYKSMVSVENHKRKYVLMSYHVIVFILWVFFGGICFLMKSELSRFLGLSYYLIILMFIQILFEAFIALWTAYQRFEYQYKLLIFITLFVSMLNPAFGFIGVFSMPDSVLGRLTGGIFAEGIIVAYIIQNSLCRVNRAEVFAVFKYALNFNLPLIPHYLSQVLLNTSDKIMIGRLIDNSSAALYGIAYTLGMLATMVTQNINNAYIPWMYRLLKNKNFLDVEKNNTVLLYSVGIIIVCVFLGAPEAILLIGGEKYVAATNVIYPVACSVAFMFMYSLFANIELFYESRKFIMIVTCSSAFLNVFLNYIFIPKYGYISAAYTTLFCHIIYGIIHVYVAKQVLYYHEGIYLELPYRHIALYIVNLLLLSCVARYLIPYPIVRYLLIVCIFVVIYVKREYIIEFYRKKKSE